MIISHFILLSLRLPLYHIGIETSIKIIKTLILNCTILELKLIINYTATVEPPLNCTILELKRKGQMN